LRLNEDVTVPRTIDQWISLALWLAGPGHFAILIASFQVPDRLEWKQDLGKLTSFNRKLMWVHGAFAVYTIISFGALTLLLHDEMLDGQRAAVALATFIGIYWLLRATVDFTYYDHSDWPKGRAFTAGHVLLTSLFIFLSVTYLAVSVRHLLA
jgi:ABC-type nickel/cobalt efflux system permease component RcnA